MTVLVTGTAGFIGNQVALALLARGDRVIGLDSVTPYYDVTLKEARLDRLKPNRDFVEARIDLADSEAVNRLFEDHHPEQVINLAAQAGVRYSLESPHSYIDSNVTGFLNILEACRHYGTKHLVYASTSSVYGANTAMPFSEHQSTAHQVSLYAATKKANEVMAHSYSCLFGIPCTGLRFFTVYGPWGRPDMALFLFTKAILEGRPIEVFNNGDMQRDFTYIDDIVAGIVRVLDRPPAVSADWSGHDPDPASSGVAPYRVFNIGRGESVQLMTYIEVLERKLGREAQKNWLPMQPGDVPATWADTTDLERETGYRPETTVEVGVSAFVDWYLDFYRAET
jgi:UDP-glucuronate 4-epimerase